MDFKEKIISFIRDKHDAKMQGNGIWYKMQCPFCGDSPNPYSTHFNLRISSEDNLMVKKCFQPGCDSSGLLDRDDLIQMGMADTEVLKYVSDKVVENREMVKKISTTELNLTIPEKKNKSVVDYFEKRTNKEMDRDIQKKYRIVSDIFSFCCLNKERIEINNELRKVAKREKYKGLNYIGFLNEPGTYLHIRSVDNKDLSHRKIPLVNFPIYIEHKPYYIKDNFNIKNKMYMCLGEGVFDVLNAYHYFNYDGVYIQTGGASGFFRIFKYYSKLYYNVKWVFLKDQDVDIDMFKKLKYIYSYRFKEDALVIYNKKAKDIGDFRDPIDIEIITI